MNARMLSCPATSERAAARFGSRATRGWRVVFFVCGLLVLGTSRGGTEADWPKQRQETFDLVWGTVHDAYFDPTFGGLDWNAVRARYAPELEKIEDNAALRPLLRGMLEELGRSHFAIIPQEAAVFAPADRKRIGTVGATIVGTSSAVTIEHVREGSPAAGAGLRPGDVIHAIDGQALAAVRASVAANDWTDSRKSSYVADFVNSRLQAVVGTTVMLTVRSEAGATHDVALKTEEHVGEWSEPVGNFPSMPVECETRQLAPGVGYLRLSSFSPGLMPQVRKYIRSLPASGGLIVDLRGNRGGLTAMAAGVAGLLTASEISLGSMHVRRGMMQFEVYPQEGAFLGPVAVLIDNASASTSEILAAGLQEAKRARLFGETSAGAAMPSSFKTLPTGDLFQFAIADVQTPSGRLIEGRGVDPEEPVVRDEADLAAGRDPVLDAASRWLRMGTRVGAVDAKAEAAPGRP